MRKPTKKQLQNTITSLQSQAFLCIMARKNAEDMLNQTLQQIDQCKQQYQTLPEPKSKPESKPEPEVKENSDGDNI